MESLGTHHILLVERDLNAARATEEMLCQWGLSISIATSGTEAVDLTKSNTYDCILVEINMPDIDGYEIARIIRLLGDNFQQVSIIGFGDQFPNMKDQNARENVLDDFVLKPFEPAIIHDMLKKYLDKDAPKVVLANLERCTEGDVEFRKELAQLLANNITELLVNLENALKHNDPHIFGRAVHKTKTTLSILGDGELNTQLSLLQKKIGQDTSGELELQVQKVNNRCRKTINILNALSA
jgi:DNA-binding response OmpR family regulator